MILIHFVSGRKTRGHITFFSGITGESGVTRDIVSNMFTGRHQNHDFGSFCEWPQNWRSHWPFWAVGLDKECDRVSKHFAHAASQIMSWQHFVSGRKSHSCFQRPKGGGAGWVDKRVAKRSIGASGALCDARMAADAIWVFTFSKFAKAGAQTYFSKILLFWGHDSLFFCCQMVNNTYFVFNSLKLFFDDLCFPTMLAKFRVCSCVRRWTQVFLRRHGDEEDRQTEEKQNPRQFRVLTVNAYDNFFPYSIYLYIF